VSKLVQTALIATVGLTALAYAGPTLVALTRALVPLVLLIGVVVAVLQLVRYFTRQ
jgi:hypothetical protein